MIYLTDENFNKEVQASEKPVLVDFFADWCPPCQILSPILEDLEKNFEGKIIFAKVNVDFSPIISQKFGVNQIPTIILFQNGKPISGFLGTRPRNEIQEWLKANTENENEMIENIIREAKEYAEKSGFKLNPDKEIVKKIAKGLLENLKKYTRKYCPCRRITGNLNEDKDKICPCVFHKIEIERNGHCFCGMFVR